MNHFAAPASHTALIAARHDTLQGRARIAGDKSLSHRALLLGAVAKGETIIAGLLESDDIHTTAAALRALGVRLGRADTGLWHVQGAGPRGWHSPAAVLDMGNSGTGARLLAGLLAGTDITATFCGDASLSRRPMKRVLQPLTARGAQCLARDDDKMPFTMRGAGAGLAALDYTLPVPSAQIKSALLLSGLYADVTTIIREPRRSRDHTEIMLRHFGADISWTDDDDKDENNKGGRVITLQGGRILQGCAVDIAGDPSAAAFPAAAAAITAGADIVLPHILVNPTRTGFYDALRAMGVDVSYKHPRTLCGEAVADIHIRSQNPLRALDLDPALVPSMIDEIPALAIVAACADGQSRLRGLGELRVKESDRLTRMACGLEACGVDAEIDGDDLIINAAGTAPAGGTIIDAAHDHRIAMAFLTLGGVTAAPITINDARTIATSFPDFAAVMNDLGAAITQAAPAFLPADSTD